MKTGMNKERIIAATTTALLVISLIGTGIYYRSNNNLKGGLKDEKLKSETLLSEKLALSKEIEKLKNEIMTWQGRSEEGDRLLAEAREKISGMEGTIKGLRKENATVTSLKKELAELKQMRKDLEAQLAALEEQNRLNAKKIDDMTAEMVALKSERDELRNTVNVLQANVTDDFRVESTKGKKKERLTLNAKKTKKLMVSFEIPQSMSDDVTFSIVTPGGKTIKSDDKSLTYVIVEDDRPMIASLSPLTGEFEVSRRIEMTYKPDRRLDPGIYKIQINHKDKHAGSCQIRLK
jgi:peptidoglycan hydrolase CwlO-like protein